MAHKRQVFISYAWESDAFRASVRALCERLRARLRTSGVALLCDFDHEIRAPKLGWHIWMQHAVEDSAVVLVVCSPLYKPRFERRAPENEGKGVVWETVFMIQALYERVGRDGGIYPIFPGPLKFGDCPQALRPFSNGHTFPDDFEKIVALIDLCIAELDGESPAPMGVPVHADAPAPAPASAPVHTSAPPFDPWHPVQGPLFFGRVAELQRLHRALDDHRSITLLGDARIGKSSLLQVWMQRVRDIGGTVAFADGQGTERQDCAALVGRWCGDTPANPGAEHCADHLQQWARRHASPGSPLPLLVLDEADHILQHFPAAFFERLRGMVSARQICLLFANRHPAHVSLQRDGKTSPLANLLETLPLGLLGEDEAGQMLATTVQRFGAQAGEEMRHWCGRHPYYLALLGVRLWENDGDFEAARGQFCEFDAKPRLDEAWFGLTEKEHQVLRAVRDGSGKGSEGLRRRGWLDCQQLFGKVLGNWMWENA